MMSLFDGIGKKIAKTGQGMMKGTKDLAEIARINAYISDAGKQIANLYTQLGQLYYSQNDSRIQEPLLTICNQITAIFQQIANCEAQIALIRGIRICAACSAEVPVGSSFCGQCGQAVAKPAELPGGPGQKYCQACGLALPDDSAFCTNCGQRLS